MLQKCGQSPEPFQRDSVGLCAVWAETWVISSRNEIQITTIHEKSFKSMGETKDSFITQDRNDDFEGGQVESTFS